MDGKRLSRKGIWNPGDIKIELEKKGKKKIIRNTGA